MRSLRWAKEKRWKESSVRVRVVWVVEQIVGQVLRTRPVSPPASHAKSHTWRQQFQPVRRRNLHVGVTDWDSRFGAAPDDLGRARVRRAAFHRELNTRVVRRAPPVGDEVTALRSAPRLEGRERMSAEVELISPVGGVKAHRLAIEPSAVHVHLKRPL